MSASYMTLMCRIKSKQNNDAPPFWEQCFFLGKIVICSADDRGSIPGTDSKFCGDELHFHRSRPRDHMVEGEGRSGNSRCCSSEKEGEEGWNAPHTYESGHVSCQPIGISRPELM